MTRFSNFRGQRFTQFGAPQPIEPVSGDFYFDNSTNQLFIYNGQKRQWQYALLTTTTSTSTTTTTTSTSTTTTSTSSSTSTSTSSTTSTSTTTTL